MKTVNVKKITVTAVITVSMKQTGAMEYLKSMLEEPNLVKAAK